MPDFSSAGSTSRRRRRARLTPPAEDALVNPVAPRKLLSGSSAPGGGRGGMVELLLGCAGIYPGRNAPATEVGSQACRAATHAGALFTHLLPSIK